MKVVSDARWPAGGERSESSCPHTPEIAASALLSSFTPVAQINVFQLLLSTFTRTHANARAYARESARVREGGEGRKKSWRSPQPCHATATWMPHGRPRWPVVATVRGTATTDPLSHATRHAATCWPTVGLPKWQSERPMGPPVKPGKLDGRGNSRQPSDSFLSWSENATSGREFRPLVRVPLAPMPCPAAPCHASPGQAMPNLDSWILSQRR